MRVRLDARRSVALGALMLLGSVAISTPSGAGPVGLPITVTGDTVPGGVLTVSGDDCLTNENNPGDVGIIVYAIDDSTPPVAGGGVTAEPDGSWSASISIGPLAEVGVTYTLDARCEIGVDTDAIAYEPFVFVMGAAPPTVDTVPDTAPDTVPDTASPNPAPSVRARPAFTG